ncbi:MAG: hypothetical protein WBG86_19350 [Polyangiales bacterium]
MRFLFALNCAFVLAVVGCGGTTDAAGGGGSGGTGGVQGTPLPVTLCDGSDEIRYVGRFTLSDGPPFPGNGFVSAYGQNFAAVDGRCRFWLLDAFDAPGAVLSGSVDEGAAAMIEELLFGFNLLVGTHSYSSSSFDAVVTLYTPDGIAIRPNAADIGSEAAAVRIERLQGELHGMLWERGTRVNGPLEYVLNPERDEDVLDECFGSQSVSWPLEDSIESFLTEPGAVGEVEGDTASELRDLADRYREGFEGQGIFSTCGVMVAVAGPDDTPYRLFMRDLVPPEVVTAEGVLTD